MDGRGLHFGLEQNGGQEDLGRDVRRLRSRFPSGGADPIGVNAVPHQMRHSGVSIDRATDRQILESISKRDRWMSQKSVIRYEKIGRLNDTWAGWEDEQKRYTDHCEANLSNHFLKGIHPPAFVKK